MWGVLNWLERNRRKENKEVTDKKINCRKNCKDLLYWMCIKLFQVMYKYLYPYTNWVLADQAKYKTWRKRKILPKLKLTQDSVKNWANTILRQSTKSSSTTYHRPISIPYAPPPFKSVTHSISGTIAQTSILTMYLEKTLQNTNKRRPPLPSPYNVIKRDNIEGKTWSRAWLPSVSARKSLNKGGYA